MCVSAGTLPWHTRGGQRTTSGVPSHLPPCLTQCHCAPAGLPSGDSPASASRFAAGVPGLERHAAVCAHPQVLGLPAQVLNLTQPVLFTLSYLPSSLLRINSLGHPSFQNADGHRKVKKQASFWGMPQGMASPNHLISRDLQSTSTPLLLCLIHC